MKKKIDFKVDKLIVESGNKTEFSMGKNGVIEVTQFEKATIKLKSATMQPQMACRVRDSNGRVIGFRDPEMTIYIDGDKVTFDAPVFDITDFTKGAATEELVLALKNIASELGERATPKLSVGTTLKVDGSISADRIVGYTNYPLPENGRRRSSDPFEF